MEALIYKMGQYRNVVIFAIAGILAVWFGFFHFEVVSLVAIYKDSIFWILTFNLLLWFYSLYKAGWSCNGLWKNHHHGLILALVLMTLCFVVCKPDYRILSDETNIVGASEGFYDMHESVVYNSVLNHTDGAKDVLIAVLDKRPSFFPYLLSICHFISGYRPENVFFLNFISGFGILFLIYYLLQLRFGRFWGLCGMGCMAAYPLFVIYISSAGFDCFNLLCALILFVGIYKFLKNPTAASAEALLLWIPLISQSRYESVVSVLVAFPLVFWKLPKEEYSKLSFLFWLLPLLFLPVAWLRIATNNAAFLQVNETENAFGLNWLYYNIKRAFIFYFTGRPAYGIIPYFSFFAVLMAVMPKSLIKNEERSVKKGPMFWAVALFYILHAIVRLSYCLADLTDPFASRLGIIFIPIFVYGTVCFFVFCVKEFKLKRIFFGLAVAIVIAFYLPDAARLAGFENIDFYWKFRLTRQYLENSLPNKNEYVIISIRPNIYVPFGYNSVFYKDLDSPEMKKEILGFYKNQQCKFFLAVQYIDLNTNQPFDACLLPSSFETRTLHEIRLPGRSFYYRLSECRSSLN